MNSSRRSHTRLRFEDKKLDIGLEITEWIGSDRTGYIVTEFCGHGKGPQDKAKRVRLTRYDSETKAVLNEQSTRTLFWFRGAWYDEAAYLRARDTKNRSDIRCSKMRFTRGTATNFVDPSF